MHHGVIPDDELAALREEAYQHNDHWLATTVSMVRMSNDDPALLSKLLLPAMAEMCRSHREMAKKLIDITQRVPLNIVVIKEKPSA